MSINQLLEEYRICQSKLSKITHHLDFLRESLKKYTIPKGLQINKEYHVIDETNDFRAAIRNILMNAEVETTEAIISHYEELQRSITEKTETLTNQIKQLETSTPNYKEQITSVEQPIVAMQEKLKQKRVTKLQKLETHVQRTEKFVKKDKPPRQRQTNTQQGRRHQLPKTSTYANATTNNYQQVSYPQLPNHTTQPDLNLIQLITNIVRQTITEISPHHYQNTSTNWRT